VRAPGFVVWFTGLPGAGKSTVAAAVGERLESGDRPVDVLDGDIVRAQLGGLGFSKEDRDTQVERLGWIASRLARAGAIVLVSAIAPYADARRKARELVEEHAAFVEVYVSTSLDECIRRDPKGLYARALAEEITSFTGISDPYEPPCDPEIEIDTTGLEPAEAAEQVLMMLGKLDLVPREGALAWE
jgi:sulfate adenylyltransferase